MFGLCTDRVTAGVFEQGSVIVWTDYATLSPNVTILNDLEYFNSGTLLKKG